MTPWHVVLILDDSGSMRSDNKIESLNRSISAMVSEMRILTGGIRPYFRLSVIRFGDKAEVLAEFQGEFDIDVNTIATLRADSGTTNAAAALDLARTVLERNPGSPTDFVPFVYFLSDGHPDSKGSAVAAASRLKALRIAAGDPRVISIGIGDVDDDFMRQVATQNHGEASYRKLDSSKELASFFPLIGTMTATSAPRGQESAADAIEREIVGVVDL